MVVERSAAERAGAALGARCRPVTLGGYDDRAGRLMVTVLAGLAELARELRRARTGERRARAKARGVKLGRFKLTLHQRKEALAKRERGQESQTEIAPSYNVSHSTISRLRA